MVAHLIGAEISFNKNYFFKALGNQSAILTIFRRRGTDHRQLRIGKKPCAARANRGKVLNIHNLSTSKHYILCLPFINTLIVDADR